jgi:F0F1-type ATP synthase assembly protein I
MAGNTPDDGAFWTITSYLIAGLGFWGGCGFAADHYLKTGYWTPVGLVVGMGTGFYLIWIRFIKDDLNKPDPRLKK